MARLEFSLQRDMTAVRGRIASPIPRSLDNGRYRRSCSSPMNTVKGFFDS